MNIKAYILLLITAPFCQHVYAQSWESLTTEDGLSQGMIFDILQDREGFIWLGTRNGLNRYNGYEFEVYKHNPFDSLSISGDEVYSLFEDSKGCFWVGTRANGLNFFDKQKKIFYHVSPAEPKLKRLTTASVNSILEDGEGRLCVSTDLGVFRIQVDHHDGQSKPAFYIEKMPIADQEDQNVAALKLTSENDLLASILGRGLFRWSEKEGRFKRILTAEAQSDAASKSIMEYPVGTFWFRMDDRGICRFREGQEDQSFILTNQNTPFRAWDIAVNEMAGQLWSSQLFDNNIYALAPETPIKPVFSLPYRTYPTDLFFDDQKNLWIGTNGFGVYKVATGQQPFTHLAKGQSVRFVDQIDQYLFFTDRLMHVIKAGEEKVSLISDLFPLRDDLRGIMQAKNGTIWALSRPLEDEPKVVELYQLSADFELKATHRVENVNPKFGQIHEDNAGNLWLPGDWADFVRFDMRTGTAQPFNCASLGTFPEFNTVYNCFYQDSEGILWKGSSSGLLRLELDNEGNPVNCQVFQNDPSNIRSLSHNTVSSCLEDPSSPDTYMWVGTKGGGLNRMHKPSGTFEHFSDIEGIPDDVIYGILPDDKHFLWLSTNRGLARFDPSTGSCLTFRAADGLQDDEFNTASFFRHTSTGKLIFGGINGLTVFLPEEIELNKYEPSVFISKLKIHSEEVQVGKPLKEKGDNPLRKAIEYTERIDLAWHQNQLTLEFVSLDLSIPKKNLYQYRLSGVNKNWVDAGTDRSVSFANLMPGAYTFEVKGSNSSGIWNKNVAQLQIVIHPPLWRTYWAYTLYTLVLILGVLTIYRFQLHRNRLKNQLLFEQREAERLAQLDRIKTNFFSNITHEFRTPLTLILEPVRQMLNKDLPAKDLNQIEEKLHLVQNNSDRLLLMVNQLLDLSKLEGGQMMLDLRRADITNILRPIYNAFLPLATQKDIALHWKVSSEIPFCFVDKDKLEKIVTNLLSNAIKYTNYGSCSLIVEYNTMPDGKPVIVLKVRDTGVGIPKMEQHRIFDRFYQVDTPLSRAGTGTGIGLALTKELLELMEGSIQVES